MDERTLVLDSSPVKRSANRLGWLSSMLVIAAIVAGLLVPFYAAKTDDVYLLLVCSRALTLASVSVSLAFLLGTVGIGSMGHAVFLGIGMYAVSILARHGVDNGFLQIALAVSVTGAFAFLSGAVSLRTSGIFFMMITLAFAQMVFYFFSGLRTYGGDDGLPVAARSRFFEGIDFANPYTLYWACFGFLLICFFGSRWLASSYYGWALRGGKINDVRMRALGVDLFAYRLAAYTLAAMMTSISGILFANVTGIAAPSFMSWQRSADFLIMVILGGLGNLAGSIAGTFAVLGLEDILPRLSDHWEIAMGVVLIGIAFLNKAKSRAMLSRAVSGIARAK